jgi:hypothetical protein
MQKILNDYQESHDSLEFLFLECDIDQKISVFKDFDFHSRIYRRKGIKEYLIAEFEP